MAACKPKPTPLRSTGRTEAPQWVTPNLTTSKILNLSLDYYLRRCYIASQPRSSKGVLRRHPEDGARRGVLRRRLGTAVPGGTGPRQPGTTTRTRGARCNRSGANAGEGSAGPEPKIATVERREAGVPRHGTQGASLGAWPAALRAGPTGASQAPDDSRRSATPRSGGSEATKQNPGAKNASRERRELSRMNWLKLTAAARRSNGASRPAACSARTRRRVRVALPRTESLRAELAPCPQAAPG